MFQHEIIFQLPHTGRMTGTVIDSGRNGLGEFFIVSNYEGRFFVFPHQILEG